MIYHVIIDRPDECGWDSISPFFDSYDECKRYLDANICHLEERYRHKSNESIYIKAV